MFYLCLFFRCYNIFAFPISREDDMVLISLVVRLCQSFAKRYFIIEIYDVGTVVSSPALRQNCNPPGSGFCSCLVGLDSDENGSFRRRFRFINPDHF